jgi:SAM-dependent methyltransferase
VDLEPLALEKARKAAARAGIQADFEVANALDLHFPDGLFDVVLDYGCFHHIVRRDWPQYRKEIARVLRPRGHLVLSVFSTEFKHHPQEQRTRDWLVHRNHYDHFFKPSAIRQAFALRFDLIKILVEKEGLNGFLHCLFRVKDA